MAYILYKSVYYLFQVTFFILIVSCFMTWLPNINWYRQPYRFFYQFSNFFFTPCRKIIPPIYGIDCSPLLAFVILGVIEKILLGIIARFLF